MFCAVTDCEFSEDSTARWRKTVKYYRFPKDEDLLEKWIAFCGREDKFNVERSWICKNHFLPMDFERNLQFEMGFLSRNPFKLLSTAVPSIRSISNHGAKDSKRAMPEHVHKNMKKTSEQDPISIENVRVESVINAADGSSCESEVLHEEEIDLKNIPKKSNIEKAAQLRPLQALRKEIIRLKRENLAFRKSARKHVVEVNNLSRSLKKSEHHRNLLEKNLRLMFTEGQIRKLRSGCEKRLIWSEEDVTRAAEMYSISRKAYELLQKYNYPLPAIRTVQNWITEGKILVANENPKTPGPKRNNKNPERILFEPVSKASKIESPQTSSANSYEMGIKGEIDSEIIVLNEHTEDDFIYQNEDDFIEEVSVT